MLVSVDQMCGWCGGPSQVVVDEGDLALWRSGALIQNAFPDLSEDDRETLLTGYHGECFDAMADGWELEFDEESGTDVAWPPKGLGDADLGKDTTKGLQGSQNGTEG